MRPISFAGGCRAQKMCSCSWFDQEFSANATEEYPSARASSVHILRTSRATVAERSQELADGTSGCNWLVTLPYAEANTGETDNRASRTPGSERGANSLQSKEIADTDCCRRNARKVVRCAASALLS